MVTSEVCRKLRRALNSASVCTTLSHSRPTMIASAFHLLLPAASVVHLVTTNAYHTTTCLVTTCRQSKRGRTGHTSTSHQLGLCICCLLL
ncbi:hypothetical protein JHK87_031524 [Glycine soja]|nr:hypothetical protein JHK87_031524 [Glycine soja]